VDITYLIGVHETRIAHHVTAIRKVDSENGPAAKFDGRAAVAVNVLVFGALEVAAKEEALDAPGKVGVRRQYIFKCPMFLASLPHEDAAVFFDDLRLDFSRMVSGKDLEVRFARDNGVAYLRNTARAQGVRRSWKT
jgi:hypothetical protein